MYLPLHRSQALFDQITRVIIVWKINADQDVIAVAGRPTDDTRLGKADFSQPPIEGPLSAERESSV
jgi:hypothetical protein